VNPSEVAWRNRAACRPKTHDVEERRQLLAWFFDGGPHYTKAKKLCAACKVQQQCLHWAVTHDSGKLPVDKLDGLWAGLTKNEREALADEWRRND